jgi:hypothetical protein
MKGALKGRGKATEEMAALMRSYETRLDDMHPALLRLRADVDAAQEQVIRTRFEVKRKLSREEWQKIFSRP